MITQGEKYSVQSLKYSIDRFNQSSISLSERLKQHENNINLYKESCDVINLHKEVLNSSQSLQSVNKCLRDLIQLRSKVIDTDRDALNAAVFQSEERFKKLLVTFTKLFTQAKYDLNLLNAEESDITFSTRVNQSNDTLDQNGEQFMSLQLNSLSSTQQSCLNYNESTMVQLEKDISNLSQMMTSFATIVNTEHSELVNRIVTNTEAAEAHIIEGNNDLLAASRMKKVKMIAYPVGGALIGTLAGGPIGLLCGLKLGLAAGLAGGLAGLGGGTLAKKVHETINAKSAIPITDSKKIS